MKKQKMPPLQKGLFVLFLSIAIAGLFLSKSSPKLTITENTTGTPADHAHTYYLKFIDAKKAADVLNDLVNNQKERPTSPTTTAEPFKLNKPATVAYDTSIQALFINASDADDQMLIDQAISLIDVKQPQVYWETVVLKTNRDVLKKFNLDLEEPNTSPTPHNLSAFIQDLASTAGVEVIFTPSAMTTNFEPASFSVTDETKTINLDIDFTPEVTNQDQVKLTLNKFELQTKIGEQEFTSRFKVPLTRHVANKNQIFWTEVLNDSPTERLVVFMTPYIINSKDDYIQILQDKLKERKASIKKQN